VRIPLNLSTLLLFGAAIILVVIIISLVDYYVVTSATNNNDNNNDDNSIGRRLLSNPSVLSKIIIPRQYALHVAVFDIALFVVTFILRKGKIT
jgi:hypothetical protein